MGCDPVTGLCQCPNGIVGHKCSMRKWYIINKVTNGPIISSYFIRHLLALWDLMYHDV